jgi:pseudaminic acid synthase
VLKPIQIGKRRIGPGHSAMLFAELSANHGQRLDIALQTVRAAAEAGADAIKLQTFTPETMTLRSQAPAFLVQSGLPGGGRSLFDLYVDAQTPWEWHAPLKAEAEACGLEFFSTPFDPTAVTLLDALGVCALKIASFELVDLPLIRAAARTGKPLILSTGMATLDEIGEAVSAARQAGATEIVLLRCTSAYPAPPESMRLGQLASLRTGFDVLVGLSDHTRSAAAAAAAVTLGAVLIEKHFILRRDIGGPDAEFSLTPDEFRNLVEIVRDVEAAIRPSAPHQQEVEQAAARYRRSLWVVREVAEGEFFTPEHVRSLRPADGLAPKHLERVLRCRASRAIAAGTPLSWELIDSSDAS